MDKADCIKAEMELLVWMLKLQQMYGLFAWFVLAPLLACIKKCRILANPQVRFRSHPWSLIDFPIDSWILCLSFIKCAFASWSNQIPIF